MGQSAGQIAWQPPGLEPSSVYHPLHRVDTFIRGWSDNDPGFDHVVESAHGISPLPFGVEISLEVVDSDEALYLIDNSFELISEPGDATVLGGSDLHIHITFFVDEDDPAFDPDQCVWESTMKLTDESGTLDDSAEFTLLFSNEPVRGGEFPPADIPATGDFDIDFDVDRFDHEAFAHCTAGPLVRPMPSDPEITDCEVECYNAFDFDEDMNIDLLDFAELQVRFGDG